MSTRAFHALICSKGGAFRNVRAEDLSAHLMRSLLARNPSLTAATLDDIYWGCV
ncbi:hypothetical protein ONQ87_24810, partial [Salmonella enterica subsp. enterica serovar Virginia]|nr:hypothetical protein [Salmonella enterica subsp. enterica serovar Virginia]